MSRAAAINQLGRQPPDVGVGDEAVADFEHVAALRHPAVGGLEEETLRYGEEYSVRHFSSAAVDPVSYSNGCVDNACGVDGAETIGQRRANVKAVKQRQLIALVFQVCKERRIAVLWDGSRKKTRGNESAISTGQRKIHSSTETSNATAMSAPVVTTPATRITWSSSTWTSCAMRLQRVSRSGVFFRAAGQRLASSLAPGRGSGGEDGA